MNQKNQQSHHNNRRTTLERDELSDVENNIYAITSLEDP